MVAQLKLFASVREAAGVRSADIDAPTVGEVLAIAADRFGSRFEALVATSNVWVNGSPAQTDTPVEASDEVAVLPPVSGGSGATNPGPRLAGKNRRI